MVLYWFLQTHIHWLALRHTFHTHVTLTATTVDVTFLAILVSENEKRDQNFGRAYINGFNLFSIKNFQLYDLIRLFYKNVFNFLFKSFLIILSAGLFFPNFSFQSLHCILLHWSWWSTQEQDMMWVKARKAKNATKKWKNKYRIWSSSVDL